MEFVKTIWANHKKKIIALIAMILTALGILTADLREAIHEATAPESKPAAIEAPAEKKIDETK